MNVCLWKIDPEFEKTVACFKAALRLLRLYLIYAFSELYG